MCHWCISLVHGQNNHIHYIAYIDYLWQILREVVTEGSKGPAINSQVIAKTTLVQVLRGEKESINDSYQNSSCQFRNVGHHCAHYVPIMCAIVITI